MNHPSYFEKILTWNFDVYRSSMGGNSVNYLNSSTYFLFLMYENCPNESPLGVGLGEIVPRHVDACKSIGIPADGSRLQWTLGCHCNNSTTMDMTSSSSLNPRVSNTYSATLTLTKAPNTIVELFKTITPSLKKKSAKKWYWFTQQHPSSWFVLHCLRYNAVYVLECVLPSNI